MLRVAKRLTLVALWALGVFVVAYTGTFAFLNDAVLGNLISGKVNKVERGTFTLKRARYSWAGGLGSILTNRPTHVVGEDFELLDPDGNVVIRVPYVEADVCLQQLVVSLAKFAGAGFHRFYLDLHFTDAWVPAGFGVITPTRSTWGSPLSEMNIFAAMSPKKVAPSDGGEFRVTVDRARLEHINFALGFPNARGEVAWYGRLEEGAGQGALVYSSRTALETPAGPYFFFKLLPFGAHAGTLQMGEYHFPLTDVVAAEFGNAGDKREDMLFRATARTLGADVQIAGTLTDAFRVPGTNLTIDFQHGLGPVQLLPSPLREWLSGDPDGQVRIRGPFSAVLIEGDVRHVRANLGADAQTPGLLIEDAAAHLKLGSDAILHLDPTTGRVAGGTLSSHIEVGLVERAWWRARLSVRGVDPARVAQVPRAIAPSVAGRLDATGRIGGSLVDHPERIYVHELDGTVERTGGGRLPKSFTLSGALDYAPTRIDLKDLHVGSGGVVLAATGSVDPTAGRLDTEVRIDAERATPLVRSFGLPAELHIDGLHASGTVSGRWPRPVVALHVAASNAGYAGRYLDNLKTELTLDRGQLRLDEIIASGAGGTLTGEVVLGLFADGDVGRLIAAPSLEGSLHARRLALGTLVGSSAVDGAADVDLTVDGPLERPHGSGEVRLPRLLLYGDLYENGKARFELDDDGARLAGISIARHGGGSLTGSARVGWDLAYDVKLLPQSFPIGAIPNVSSLPFTIAGSLSGDLQIAGDPDGWMPGGHISLSGFRLRQTPLGDGKLTLEPGGDASHVHGSFFNKLVTVDGTLTPFPKFAAHVTIKFEEVSLESIFPELKQLADVTGKASGEATVTFNLESGVTAALTLRKIKLTLSGTEEDGHVRHLDVSNRDPVVISSNGAAVVVRPAKLYSTLGEFYFEAKEISAKQIDARMNGQIGLELLEYFFRSAFDHTDGNAYVNLTVTGDPTRPILQGRVDLRKVVLQPRGLEHRLAVTSGSVDFDPTGVKLSGFNVVMDGAIAHASGSVALDGWKPGAIDGRVDGELSAKLLQWLVSDKIAEASGRVAVDVKLEGQWSHPKWLGSAQLKDLHLQVRRFDHDILINAGSINFVDYRITLGCPPGAGGCKSLTGTLDGQSAVQLDGDVGFGEDLSLRNVDLHLVGSDIRHSTHQYGVTLSPDVRLRTLPDGRYKLTGSVPIVEGRYTQKFDVVHDAVIRARAVEVDEPFWQGDPRFETMQLAVRAVSQGALYINAGVADLTVSANLEILGTLSEPRINGTLQVEEGGTFNLGQRNPLTSDAGRVYFESDKKIPDGTPTFDINATGLCTDRQENQHTIVLKLTGTLKSPLLTISSLEGWDQSTSLLCLFAGRTQEDLRKLAQGDPSAAQGRGISASEGLSKTVSGAVINEVLSDPVRKVIGLDTTSIELGQGSVDVKLCKRFGRMLKTCGQGEYGFLGSGSRVQGQGELKLSDYFSGLLRVEYLMQGVDTLEDSPTRLKLELNVRIPLGY